MASVYAPCGAFHFILQGRPPLSHLFETLFSGLFPGWLLLGVRSPRTIGKSLGATVSCCVPPAWIRLLLPVRTH